MHYVDEGEGIPVLLYHGNPDGSFFYRHIIKELFGECRFIAHDLPGFGHSRVPEDYGFTPREHADEIKALVFDNLKRDKFIVVVGDWCGPTVLHVATTHPDHTLGGVITNTTGFRAFGIIKLFSFFQDFLLYNAFTLTGIFSLKN